MARLEVTEGIQAFCDSAYRAVCRVIADAAAVRVTRVMFLSCYICAIKAEQVGCVFVFLISEHLLIIFLLQQHLYYIKTTSNRLSSCR